MKKIIMLILISILFTCNIDFNFEDYAQNNFIIYFVKGTSKKLSITYSTSEGPVKVEKPNLPFELTVPYIRFKQPFQLIVENEDSSGTLYVCINEICEHFSGEGVLTLSQREDK